jgi:hypothetical protein
MINTGVFASKEDLKKIIDLISLGWQPGERMIVFSVGDGIKKDNALSDAKNVCHQLALNYGLPEIPGMYGITKEGEFISN